MEDSHRELGLTPPSPELTELYKKLRGGGQMAAVVFMDPHPPLKQFINLRRTVSMSCYLALETYANTHNPASVIIYGDTELEINEQAGVINEIAKREDYFDYINQFI